MKKILAVVILISMIMPGLSIIAQTIQEMEAEQQEVQQQIRGTQGYLEVTQQEIAELEEEIRAKDMAIEFAAKQLEMTENFLETTKEQLYETEIALEEARQEFDHHFENLQSRLRVMYILGPVKYLEVVLQANSFDDFLTRLSHMNTLARSDREIAQRLQKAEDLVAYKVDEISRQVLQIEDLQAIQAERLSDLEDALHKQHYFMYNLEQDAHRYEVALQLLQQTDRQITESIQRARAEEERLARLAQEAARRRGQVVVQPSGGSMAWPLPANFRTISSGYGYRPRPFNRRLTEFHTGIDLPAPRGTNIYAAESGTVILSGWHGGYGRTVIIQHGDGITTLYGHNSENLVSVGDWVNRGQRIARVGSTGVSTGNHLHFEVRRNGSHVNPGPFLGIR